MAVWELKVVVDPGAVAAIEEWLAETQEQRLILLEDKPSGHAWLSGYLETVESAEKLRADLTVSPIRSHILGETQVGKMEDSDWQLAYRSHFKAWRFGPLAWVPAWERDTFVPLTGESVLWLDPGMAFGTGNHETTRLCCERLIAFTQTRGARGAVIDAGCGSGILALSAVRLGYQDVLAFDNDPVAVGVSAGNARMNELSGRVRFVVADLEGGLAGNTADMILANIQADVLMSNAASLANSVRPSGQLILSGILRRELAAVQAVFAAKTIGWSLDSRSLGEWADLALGRPA